MKSRYLLLLGILLTGAIAVRGGVPEFTASPTSLEGFTTTVNTPSAAQTLSLNGSDFAGPVTLTTSTGFEVSLDGINFRRSQVYGQGGRLQSVYDADFGTHSGSIWFSGSGRQYPNGFAFAALQPDGSVTTWGNSALGGNSSAYSSLLAFGVSEIISHYGAFAALKNDGSVVVWGYPDGGGGSSSVASQLASGVQSISSSRLAFAALKSDGSVVTWGAATSGGDSTVVASQLTAGVTKIYSSYAAFAALKSDGSVVTWGDAFSGGDSSAVSSQLASGVTAIYASQIALAALKSDGSVVTWGNSGAGGDSFAVSSQLISGVTAISASQFAFAALKTDGSVVTWGDAFSGGDSTPVASLLSSGVASVTSNQAAFAALKSDGSVVAWGDSSAGGDSSAVSSQLASGVTAIYSSMTAFAALKHDGSVVTWGDAVNGGDSSLVSSQLASGVTAIYSSASAFAALKHDGSVVTWGNSGSGGDSSAVAGQLTSGVTTLYSTQNAFAAVKGDGTLVAWGNAGYGGSGGPVNIGASAVTVPVDVQVRLAANANVGPVSGSLILSSLGAANVAVSLSGAIGASLPEAIVVATTASLTAFEGLVGGGEIYRPFPGVINAANQVAFPAFGAIGTGGVSGSNDCLLLTDTSGDLHVIAREGTLVDASPATTLQGLFTGLRLTESGQTVAFDRIKGASTSRDQAYLTSTDGETLEILSRTGDSAAGGGGFKALGGAFVTDGAGRIYFMAMLSGTGVNAKNDSGLWQEDAGTQTLIAREGSDVSSLTTDAAWLGFVQPRLSAGGDGVAFVAGLQNNPANRREKTDSTKNEVVLDGNEGGLSLILRKGDVVADADGAALNRLLGVSRSGTGSHAVSGLLKTEGAVTRLNDAVLLAVSGGTVNLVAREGVTLVGGSTVRQVLEYHAIGDDEVIFLTDRALCRWTVADGIVVLARTGAAAPGAGSNFTRLAAVSVSEGGAVALTAQLADGKTGLWRALPGGALSLVLRSGDATTVNSNAETILAFAIQRSAGTVGAGGAGGGAGAAINDAGTIFATLSVGNGVHVARRLYP